MRSGNAASLWPGRVKRYVCATVAYGFVRATTYDRRTSMVYHNRRTGEPERKDMLLVDRVGSVCVRSLLAATAWPMMLAEDLAWLECAARGRDAAEYSSWRDW